MADGSVVFEVGLSTDKFERQLANLEKQIAKEEDKQIDIEAQMKGLVDDEEIEKIIEARVEVKRLNEAMDQTSAAWKQGLVGPMTSQQFTEAQIRVIELNQYLKESQPYWDKMIAKGDALQRKLNASVEKVSELKGKMAQVRMDKQVADVNKVKEGFNSVGSAIQGAVKKAGKLALGIFAIRSAYMMVRRASSELAGYDDQYSANLEYIRYVLTEAIAPILRGIVQLAAKLLGYINAIVQGWFGISLFGKGSVDAFKKMKQSAGGVSDAVQEIKKQLTGFDEMNILQENGETTRGGGGGGVTAPDIDIDDYNGEPPEWLQWIIDHKDEVIAGIIGISAALIGIKLGLEGITALGIGALLAGVYLLVKDIIKFIDDPSWENFLQILGDIAIIIGAIMLLMGNWWGLLVVLIGLIVKFVVDNWESIKQTLSQVGDWIYNNVIKPVGEFFTGMWEGIKAVFAVVGTWFEQRFTEAKTNIVRVFQNIGKWFSDRWHDITSTFSKVGTWFSDRFKEAYEGIKRVFQNIGDFFGRIWDRIKQIFTNIGQRIGEAVSGAFKSAVNAVFTILENILNAPIRAINGLIGIINAIPGINLGYLNTFSLPRLAVGGIVNVPNTGTLVGGAIAGESGPEGVIPLTDTQAMETLGEAIGRHVTINATVLNKMNGRVISRSLQQVQTDGDFAFNT